VFHARIERGAGRGVFGPLHGGQKEAAEQLSRAQRVVLAGTRPPVASLTYPGLPGLFIPDETPCHQLARQNDDVAGALEAVAEALGATARGAIYDHVETGPPRGPVDPKSIGRAIAATLPENAIVAAEATTSGGPIFGSTRTCRPHSWLGMTGGSIGLALPLSTGAAVACPDRKVLCIQSDGGGMYVNQALWTHAREGLDIVTVILTNRRYRILEHEYLKDGSNQVGPVAGRLFDLGNPSIEWTHLAKGMGVEAQKAETAEDLTTALDRGFAEPGPYLIDAVMDGT
jgi:acetolactate synthase-1/2/3 large subunit